jgi:hypothetical protein
MQRAARRPILSGSEYRLGKPVVFGHTPQRSPGGEWRPFVRPDRIGIDRLRFAQATGSGFGGPVTALMLPEGEFFSGR